MGIGLSILAVAAFMAIAIISGQHEASHANQVEANEVVLVSDILLFYRLFDALGWLRLTNQVKTGMNVLGFKIHYIQINKFIEIYYSLQDISKTRTVRLPKCESEEFPTLGHPNLKCTATTYPETKLALLIFLKNVDQSIYPQSIIVR